MRMKYQTIFGKQLENVMLQFRELFHTVEILVLKKTKKTPENVTSYSVSHARTHTHRDTQKLKNKIHINIFLLWLNMNV